MTESPQFSLRGYGEILEQARSAGYALVPMCESDATNENPHMILRHDVDISLECALAMAEFEASIGARSTYFILLYNDFYNPLAPSGRGLVKQIADLGHEIGLHWDSSLYPSDAVALENSFRRDIEALNGVIGQPVRSASQHIPIDSPNLDVESLIEFEAYSGELANRYEYVSDSCMAWRGEEPADLIRRGTDIQFLSHPIWWVLDGAGIEDKLKAAGDQASRNLFGRLDREGEHMIWALTERERLDREFRTSRSSDPKET